MKKPNLQEDLKIKLVKALSDDSMPESVSQLSADSMAESMGNSADESNGQSTHQFSDLRIGHAVKESAERRAGQSIDELVNRQLDQPIILINETQFVLLHCIKSIGGHLTSLARISLATGIPIDTLKYALKRLRETGSHIITQINSDRKALNEMIRDDLKAQGRLVEPELIQIREAANLSAHDKRFTHNYHEGDIILAQKGMPGMIPGTEAMIRHVDTSHGMLLLTTTDGKDLNIETAQYGDRLQVFQPSEKEFAIGDSVVFTKNDKALNVQNGLTGVIKGIDDNLNISIETKGGRMVDIDSQQYQYMDHAYASTDFKSQGASYRNVIFTGESERANSNEFYVAVSRTKEDFQMIVNNKEEYFENAKMDQDKTSTLDYTQTMHETEGHRRTVDQIELGSEKGQEPKKASSQSERAFYSGKETDAEDILIESDFHVEIEKDAAHENALAKAEVEFEK